MSLSYRSSLGTIVFSNEVLETFSKNRQLKVWSSEAGGQLFCRFGEAEVLIQDASNPGRRDKRSRFSFWPNRDQEQSEIDRQFQNGLHYCGDWHTHPESYPTPSSADIQKIMSIFQKSQHQLSAMVLVVVGQAMSIDGLWVGLVRENDIEKCHSG